MLLDTQINHNPNRSIEKYVVTLSVKDKQGYFTDKIFHRNWINEDMMGGATVSAHIGNGSYEYVQFAAQTEESAFELMEVFVSVITDMVRKYEETWVQKNTWEI